MGRQRGPTVAGRADAAPLGLRSLPVERIRGRPRNGITPAVFGRRRHLCRASSCHHPRVGISPSSTRLREGCSSVDALLDHLFDSLDDVIELLVGLALAVPLRAPVELRVDDLASSRHLKGTGQAAGVDGLGEVDLVAKFFLEEGGQSGSEAFVASPAAVFYLHRNFPIHMCWRWTVPVGVINLHAITTAAAITTTAAPPAAAATAATAATAAAISAATAAVLLRLRVLVRVIHVFFLVVGKRAHTTDSRASVVPLRGLHPVVPHTLGLHPRGAVKAH
jgi:hypothetical protein